MQLSTCHPPAGQSPARSSFLQTHERVQYRGARGGGSDSQGKPPSQKKTPEDISGRGKKSTQAGQRHRRREPRPGPSMLQGDCKAKHNPEEIRAALLNKCHRAWPILQREAAAQDLAAELEPLGIRALCSDPAHAAQPWERTAGSLKQSDGQRSRWQPALLDEPAASPARAQETATCVPAAAATCCRRAPGLPSASPENTLDALR